MQKFSVSLGLLALALAAGPAFADGPHGQVLTGQQAFTNYSEEHPGTAASDRG